MTDGRAGAGLVLGLGWCNGLVSDFISPTTWGREITVCIQLQAEGRGGLHMHHDPNEDTQAILQVSE